ncbi:MAG: sigma-70 family RNA polymerase sigma factor [Alistipes sp.]|nr:sigma-70 family RNA polymerase sigma factor [Alistipes sp.]
MRRQINDSYPVVRQDLMHDAGIFSEEEHRTRALRMFIQKNLTQAEQTIILLYAEYGSSRQVAKTLNIPRTTMQREINRIKTKIQHGVSKYITLGNNYSICC